MIDGEFTPTNEQLACVAFAKSSQENLLIEALAGAAKTTTLELICKALSGIPILSLAFNKRIAEEMTKRLPGHVMPKTLNAIGHKVWLTSLGRKGVKLEPNKLHTILKAIGTRFKGAEKQEFFDGMADTLKLCRIAKAGGYVPVSQLEKNPNLIMTNYHYDITEVVDFDPSPFQLQLLNEVLTISIDEAFAGTIDFDDQIYMPTLFGGQFPRFPLVLIDEAQDLSPLNHAMLDRLVTKRLIAVGDPYQSIYGFRGAMANSMNALAERFRMTRLPLSTSFRCPRSIVKMAQRRAPHMRWPEWASEGRTNILNRWTYDDIPEHAAVICRNNAPLFRLGLDLIRNHRGVHILGADIGPGLIRVLKKLGPEDMTQSAALAKITEWEREEIRKSKKKAALADRAACLRVFVGEGKTLGAAVAYADHLFKSEGSIQLLSGHKAKGLEWDSVFHLDPWRIPSKWAETPDAIEQELNIGYVILTRARESYTEICMNNFGEES